MTREWDARAYDALPLPHTAWGAGVVQLLLHRTGDPAGLRVLDVGCGTGRDAALLLERAPGIELTVLDGSTRMLAAARERLGGRAAYVHADLRRPLLPGPLAGPVDAVVSVAALHWLPDHDTLWHRLADVLAPGGTLVTDCGGRGNVAHVSDAVASVLGRGTDPGPWTFAGAAETRARLQRAGLEVDGVRLRPDPFRCEDPALLERYLATVVLGSHLEAVPTAERPDFVRAVREAMREPVVDYVRLEVEAHRPAHPQG